MKNRYLPLGTVCLLKGANKRLMIIGFCIIEENKPDKTYDYMGCVYPEGVLSTSETLLFNHDQIERIDYLGFSDHEEKNFKKLLVQHMSKKSNNIQNNNVEKSTNIQNNTINNANQNVINSQTNSNPTKSLDSLLAELKNNN